MSPLAVYIHWPYCARICPYCDFNVYKSKGEAGDDLVAAIALDLKYWRGVTGPRNLTSIHFGGGTPSLMTPAQIEALIGACQDLWTAAPDIEIGLEANPDDGAPEKWAGYKEAGLNRLSVGIQSFDDATLKFLGRNHDGAAARRALDLACDIFDNVSADLIFGHRGQTEAAWQSDLDIALSRPITHLSAYQLTIEDGTAFGRAARRGKALDVNEDMSAALYDMTMQRLKSAGFTHYEVSNYERSDSRSAHNMAYWTGLDYVGVGPGAHGRITTESGRAATIAHMTPAAYIRSVTDTGHGAAERELLSAQDVAEEYVMMGLRIVEGLDLRHPSLSGRELNSEYLEETGWVIRSADRLKATDKGRLVLNEVTRRLLT